MTPKSAPDDPPATPDTSGDVAALARGGRTNFFGFLLRLMARLPFLFIAGQLYGANTLGRFAYATLVVELTAQFATLGLKRGLAAAMARSDDEAHVVWDGVVLAWASAALGAAVLALFPQIVFPNSFVTGMDRAFPLIALAIAGSDVALAALAYRGNIAATVRARSLIEPWVLTLVAGGLAFTHFKRDGLILAYAASMVAALAASIAPCVREFGLPEGWRPHPAKLAALARANVPLAGADAIEWGTRRLDLFVLGIFASPAAVGVYYVAQQVASLPQKLKTSFDPVLGPMLSRSLVAGDRVGMAGNVRQVGFWVIGAQLCVALALAIPAPAILRLVGHEFDGGQTVTGVLLIAEVLAATAAVSEDALVYTSPARNLLLSVLMIGVEGALALILVPLLAPRGAMPAALGAALALTLALTLGSVLKSRRLHRDLGAPVAGLRWPLLTAALGGLALALPIRMLPDIAQIAIGIPAVILVYGVILWRWGLKPEDRVLFRRA